VARVAVVIPCYNEEERLDRARIEQFAQAEPDVELWFVDDGSQDRTRELLESLRTACPDTVRVVVLEHNSGKAEAVRQGVLRALESDPRHVGYWDADLATPLDDIPRFAALLDSHPELEIVFGSRVKLLGRHVERKLTRHYFGRVFATVVSVTLGLPVYDTQCGAKLFRVTPDLKGLFDRPFLSRWIFDVEIIARLIAARGRGGARAAENVIYEFPLMWWEDVHGSKLRPRDFAKAAVDLYRIWGSYLRRVPHKEST
jgi:glycosyltransferase involved in cell wall biosynthesis